MKPSTSRIVAAVPYDERPLTTSDHFISAIQRGAGRLGQWFERLRPAAERPTGSQRLKTTLLPVGDDVVSVRHLRASYRAGWVEVRGTLVRACPRRPLLARSFRVSIVDAAGRTRIAGHQPITPGMLARGRSADLHVRLRLGRPVSEGEQVVVSFARALH